MSRVAARLLVTLPPLISVKVQPPPQHTLSLEQGGIFRHVLISAERSFVMKGGGGDNTVKDGIHIQIPAERAGLTDGEGSRSEARGAVQSKSQGHGNLGKVEENYTADWALSDNRSSTTALVTSK